MNDKLNSNKDNNNSYNTIDEDIDFDNTKEIEELEELSKIEIKEHLSEDFKKNLAKMMAEEYEKQDNETSTSDSVSDSFEIPNDKSAKKTKNHSFAKRLAIAFSCFIIISSAAFGKNFSNIVQHIFSNQDKSIDLAVENGYYQTLNMDYVVHDGVGIKIDYIYADDICIYVVLNIYCEEEFENIYIGNIELRNEDGIVVFSNRSNNSELSCISEEKKNNSHNSIIVFRINNNENAEDIFNYDKLEANINNVVLNLSSNNKKEFEKSWNFNFNIDKHSINSPIMYYLKNNEKLIEDYKIVFKNYKLRTSLRFNSNYINNNDLKREKIYLEDVFGEKYYCDDIYVLKNNKLNINFSLDDKNLDNLKLIVICKDKENIENKMIFKLSSENGDQN